MKTVKQYLQEIPDPVTRDRALANCYQEYGSESCKDLPAAISRAFLWHRAPEGFDFWNLAYREAGGTKQYLLIK